MSEKLKLEAYQKKACENALKPFFAKATNLDLLDTPIRDMSKVQALRLIAAAMTSYELELGKIFDQHGAHDELPYVDKPAQMNQACPQCGGREWLFAKRSPRNKKLAGMGCKKCSHVVWINEHEAHHYGVTL